MSIKKDTIFGESKQGNLKNNTKVRDDGERFYLKVIDVHVRKAE